MIAARLLVTRPLARVVRWGTLCASALPAVWLVWHFGSDVNGNVWDLTLGLRLAGLSLAIGVSFSLDDPTDSLTAPSPVSLLARRVVRVALTLLPPAVWWTLLAVWANAAPFLEEPLPVGSMLFEVMTFSVVGLAGAALGTRWLGDGLGGPAGAGAVIVTGVAAALLPWGAPLLGRGPGTADRWWWTILIGAGAVLVNWSRTPVPAPLRSLSRRRPRRRRPPP